MNYSCQITQIRMQCSERFEGDQENTSPFASQIYIEGAHRHSCNTQGLHPSPNTRSLQWSTFDCTDEKPDMIERTCRIWPILHCTMRSYKEIDLEVIVDCIVTLQRSWVRQFICALRRACPSVAIVVPVFSTVCKCSIAILFKSEIINLRLININLHRAEVKESKGWS